ncbi:DUF1727 domain-containing protein [Candidatus Saccharibacteria bacterium]|nr:DUF1727 domain-containing protein [Candidatus Saccharibacteria bacterium]
MPRKHTIAAGKLFRRIARLRGGGSALPGLLIEKLEPAFLSEALGQLPEGVILVSGTNGKTTTTKMITELLEASGLRVFTNRTGSNFTRGVVSALIEAVNKDGTLPYDIAVLELDEAHAVKFAAQAKPRISVFLNVLRDQLDRFGEIDYTARLLGDVAAETTEMVILNYDDPLIKRLAKNVQPGVKTVFFGAHDNLHHLFLSDEMLGAVNAGKPKAAAKKSTTANQDTDVELCAFKDQLVGFRVGSKVYKSELKVSGFYNYLNAAAAISTVRQVKPRVGVETWLKALTKVEPAFGRGERVMHHGKPLEFVLVKNPAGFRLALASAGTAASTEATMIAINDNFADGRDMSWLWDVDFSSLKDHGVAMISGVRAYDMALRLQYDAVTVGDIEPDTAKAFKAMLSKHGGKPMRIYCTYTAMLKLRRQAEKELRMEKAL